MIAVLSVRNHAPLLFAVLFVIVVPLSNVKLMNNPVFPLILLSVVAVQCVAVPDAASVPISDILPIALLA